MEEKRGHRALRYIGLGYTILLLIISIGIISSLWAFVRTINFSNYLPCVTLPSFNATTNSTTAHALSVASCNSTYTQWIIALAAAIIGIMFIQHIGGGIFKRISATGIHKEAGAITNLFKFVAYSLLIIIVLDLLSINITALLISAGFLGIVVGLAAQNTIGNIFAGITLIVSKPFELNDEVTVVASQYGLMGPTYAHDRIIPGYSGIVDSIGLLYTKFVSYDNEPFYMPNNILMQAMIINHKRAENRALKVNLEVDHTIPVEKVESKIKSVLKAKKVTPGNIRVEYLSADSYRVSFVIIAKDGADRIKSEVLRELVKYVTEMKGKK